MNSINNKIDSFNFNSQLVEMNTLLSTGVKCGFDFFGRPSIKISDYSGSVSVESIAQRLLQAGKERCEADNLSLPERIAAVEIIEKLKVIYCQIDDQYNKENYSTVEKIFMYCQKNAPFSSSRILIEEYGELPFLVFSHEKFIKEFGDQFEELDDDFENSDELFQSDFVPNLPSIKIHPDSNGEADGKILAQFESIVKKSNESMKNTKIQTPEIAPLHDNIQPVSAKQDSKFLPVSFEPIPLSAQSKNKIEALPQTAVQNHSADTLKQETEWSPAWHSVKSFLKIITTMLYNKFASAIQKLINFIKGIFGASTSTHTQ